MWHIGIQAYIIPALGCCQESIGIGISLYIHCIGIGVLSGANDSQCIGIYLYIPYIHAYIYIWVCWTRPTTACSNHASRQLEDF